MTKLLSILRHSREKNLLLFLFGLSLPFKDQYSTIVLIIALAFSLYVSLKSNTFIPKAKDLWILLIPLLLLTPRLLGLFTGIYPTAIDEVVRSLPLILLPVTFVIWRGRESVKQLEKGFFFGLLTGIVLFFVICNFFVIEEMIRKNEPFEYLFRWRNLNVNFVKPLETHPPYVGLLTIYVFVVTLFSNFIKSSFKLPVLLVLSILLFQALARNAIITAILVSLIYSFSRLKLKAILFSSIAVIGLLAIVVFHPHPYLREKILYKLNPFDQEFKDKRVGRLEASIAVFKDYPLIGTGPGYDNQFRRLEYERVGDQTAFERNFNSHNQFFEFLVFSGIIGLLCFIAALFLLIKSMVMSRDVIYLILMGCFILACLSESVLERSLGIKYFGVLITLIMMRNISESSKGIQNDNQAS